MLMAAACVSSRNKLCRCLCGSGTWSFPPLLLDFRYFGSNQRRQPATARNLRDSF